MIFPIAFFLIPYAIFILLFFFFALMSLSHLVKYSATNMATFIATFTFLAVATLICYASYNMIMTVDWSYPVVIIANFNAPTF